MTVSKAVCFLMGLFTLSICKESGSPFTVPLTRKIGNRPMTKTQKMLYEFHDKRMREGIRLEQFALDTGKFGNVGGTTDARIDLNNFLNLQYTGPVFLGTPLEGSANSEFMYDTGSGTLTATSENCIIGCTTHYYDPSKSSTANMTNISAELGYGSANLTGQYVRDRACLSDDMDLNLCVDNFTLFEITEA